MTNHRRSTTRPPFLVLFLNILFIFIYEMMDMTVVTAFQISGSISKSMLYQHQYQYQHQHQRRRSDITILHLQKVSTVLSYKNSDDDHDENVKVNVNVNVKMKEAVKEVVKEAVNEVKEAVKEVKEVVMQHTTNQSQSQNPKKKKRRVVSSTPIPNLFSVNTLEEYTDFMDRHKTDLVVIRFYAPWCKACASVAPSYNRLARRNPKACFLDIAYSTKNTNLYETLNVPYVPYGHIFSSNQLVDEMKMSKSNWKVFEQSVKDMIRGYCTVDDYMYEKGEQRQQRQPSPPPQQIETKSVSF